MNYNDYLNGQSGIAERLGQVPGYFEYEARLRAEATRNAMVLEDARAKETKKKKLLLLL